MVNIDNKYAVVGMGCIFPDADNIDQFWKNIINGKISIGEVDNKKLNSEVFYRPEMYNRVNKEDKSYTRVGAQVKNFKFDGNPFRIPPTVARHMDENQKVALLAVQQALNRDQIAQLAKDRVSVFMGTSGYGELYHDFHKRFNFEQFAYYLERSALFSGKLKPGDQKKLLDELRAASTGESFGITEDSAPGMLPNIVASRIANVYDLHGTAYTLDSACASGLAAITVGIRQLRDNEADAVICGAVDMPIMETGFIYFSGINALSPDGSYPFDERANGFVIGQGGGAIILKRLADAIAAHDSIHAVITGFSSVNDGKGKAIAAPNSRWQAKTIEEACKMAGYPIDTVELIEAHGTATQVGDLSEVTALKEGFANLGVTGKKFCGITSVKSNIGHLKSAAGIAGFIKAALAVQHKTLPAIAGFSTVNKKLELEHSPFYILNNNREWAAKGHPRRAGVNAFGFGGVNYHIGLEEYRPEDYQNIQIAVPKKEATGRETYSQQVTADEPTARNPFLFIFGARSQEELFAKLHDLKDKTGNKSLAELAHESALHADATLTCRVSFVCYTKTELLDCLETFINASEQQPLLKKKGIFFSKAQPLSREQLAFMFPGQGSQYPDMLAGLAEGFSSAADIFSRADSIWEKLNGISVTELIRSTSRGKEKTTELLKETIHTHPAIFTCDYAAYSALKSAGLEPGYVIGHSAGEIAALAAAGVLSFNDGLRLMNARAQAFATSSENANQAMAAVYAAPQEIKKILKQEKLPLWMANYNSPAQTIISGEKELILKLSASCESKEIKCIPLHVSRAFHSPLVKEAQERFKEYLDHLDAGIFNKPRYKVIRNETSEYYPEQGNEIREQLATQICEPVQFSASIENLYQAGVRLFIEVGPGTVLSTLVKDTLNSRDCQILSFDQKNKNVTQSFYRLLGELFTAGLNIDLLPVKSSAQTNTGSADNIQSNTKQYSTNSDGGESAENRKEKIVYSGVAIGLPGSYKDCFQDDNFEQLFAGHNCIEHLSDLEKQSMLDLNITKLVKSERGASYISLSTLNDVIQLSGKLGKLDMETVYKIEPKDIANMSNAIACAVAAGFEALRDAQIPLIHEYARTASGALLPNRWSLPQEMQKDTGVIFANGFPMLDTIIQEVSRHLSFKFKNAFRTDIFEFYQDLLNRVTDKQAKRVLAEWYAQQYQHLAIKPGSDEVYNFNYHLMSRIASQANNRLAQYINAQGPNFSINAACSSTATAITLAEEMIKSGRVRRMIIIGADDTANARVLPYLGAGFLSTGACTNEGDIYKAAVPFDKRRNGMIMGSGAVGIIVEAAIACEKRSVKPVAELLGTHCFNTAGHQSQLEIHKYAEELETFMCRMEKEHGLNRQTIAPQMLYMSHETYTPARGGCSQAEAVSLRHVFGDTFTKIEISNTKGMTGHTMGASLEDAVAARALQYGKIPPVVNHKEKDPELAGLKLATGGAHNCSFALRMAAGFGAQGNFLLLKKEATGDERIIDKSRYHTWLKSVSHLETPSLEYRGRILTIRDSRPGAVEINKSIQACTMNVTATTNVANHPKRIEKQRNGGVKESVYNVISSITGYAPDMLENDMELEADLGIDTVKQATILSMLSEKFGTLDKNQDIRISDYPTIDRLIDLFAAEGSANIAAQQSTNPESVKVHELTQVYAHAQEHEPSQTVKEEVFDVIAGITGYDQAMLELEMELEADLGVDTVKQATILSTLNERLGCLEKDAEIRISDFPTIGHLIKLFSGQGTKAATTTAQRNQQQQPTSEAVVAEVEAVDEMIPKAGSPSRHLMEESFICPEEQGLPAIIEIIAANSDYTPEMLEDDLNLEVDLGFDAQKLEQIRQAVQSKAGITTAWKISPAWTIRMLKHHVQEMINKNTSSQAVNLPVTPTGVSRLNLTLVEQPALFNNQQGQSGKFLLIIADDRNLADKLKSGLKDNFHTIQTLLLSKEEKPEQTIQQYEGFQPTVIIDLTTGYMKQAETIEENKKRIELATDYRYAVVKYLNAHKHKPEKVLCITFTGHAFGLKESPASQKLDPIYGLFSGFYKALRKEWKDTDVTILDVDPVQPMADEKLFLQSVLGELAEKDNGVEVCWLNGTRYAVVADDSSFDTVTPLPSLHFDAKDMIIVTGGASGITAEIVKEFSRRFRTNFAILGRTQLLANTQKLAAMNEDELMAYKKNIQNELTLKNTRITPVMLDEEFSKVLKCIDICRLVNEVRNNGCGIRYYAVDVRDKTEMESVLNAIREEHGPITGIIHGAGLEISHLIEKKTLKEFHNVLSTKAEGALNLEHLCKADPLKFVALFSSISGRFGHAAQLDYSAANDYLNFLARALRRNKGIHAISLIWSGWNSTGMAYRNTYVRENAEKAGLNLMEVKDASAAALYEICSPRGESDVLIHRGLGELREKTMSTQDFYHLPFIDRFDHNGKYPFRSYRIFSIQRDEFINQHRLTDTPLMPGVGYMEMMAEHFYAITKKPGPILYRNLQFPNAFKLYKGVARELTLHCRPLTEQAWLMKLTAPVPLQINIEAEIKEYASAEVSLLENINLPFEPTAWDPGPLTKMSLTEFYKLSAQFKQNVVFGPLFNDTKRKNRVEADDYFAWSPKGAINSCRFPQAQIGNPNYPLARLLINPAFLDTMHQTGAILCIMLTNQLYLPLGAAEFGVVKPQKTNGVYKISIMVKKQDENKIFFDMVMQNQENELCYYIKDSVFHRIHQ